MRHPPINQKQGFTLLELLITVAIISMLASLAYPSYLDYLTRIRRSDGQTTLLELANQMEQYFSTNNTYRTATIGTGSHTDLRSNATSPDGWYNLSIIEQTDSSYTLQAAAMDAQAKNDKGCQNLTFNSRGEKGIAGNLTQNAGKAANRCWQ